MLAWIVNYNKESPEFRQLVHLPDDFTFGVDDPYAHLVMGSNEQVVPYEDHDDLLGLAPPELGKRGERQYFKNPFETQEDELKWLKAQVDKAIDLLLPGLPAGMAFTTRVSRLMDDCKRINRSREEIKLKTHSEQCHAVLFHGPGHQSRTKCQLTGPHEIHKAIYGGYDREANWKGDKACTGFFDDPPSIDWVEDPINIDLMNTDKIDPLYDQNIT